MHPGRQAGAFLGTKHPLGTASGSWKHDFLFEHFPTGGLPCPRGRRDSERGETLIFSFPPSLGSSVPKPLVGVCVCARA